MSNEARDGIVTNIQINTVQRPDLKRRAGTVHIADIL
jgi:hypothetical protein